MEVEIKLWKRAHLGTLGGAPSLPPSPQPPPSPLGSSFGNHHVSPLMFRLISAHCYWRLVNVNSSQESVSTPMVEPWGPRRLGFICLFVFSLWQRSNFCRQENDRKWERKEEQQRRRRWNLISWSWLDFSWDQTGLVHFAQLGFMDCGKWIIPDAER